MKIIQHREHTKSTCGWCHGDDYLPDGQFCPACDGSGSVWRHDPAVGECKCGAEVVLDAFTNTCPECGADYNMSGQLLAPRSQWGEETGEHWTECI